MGAGETTTARTPGKAAGSRLHPVKVLAAVGGFAFLIHLPWEFLQVPLYRGIADAPHWDATLFCLRATAGDAGLTLSAYLLVAARVGAVGWLDRPEGRWVAGFLALSVALAISLELLSVHVLGRWAYGEAMPVIAGVGLSPLLQWVLLPPLGLMLARRHLGIVHRS